MLQTYVGEQDQYKILKQTISDFIVDVEDNGKHE
jgi:hypothetical protein